MIHVDALDFSEWHSEEVISFFWRSVYVGWTYIEDSLLAGIEEKFCDAYVKNSYPNLVLRY